MNIATQANMIRKQNGGGNSNSYILNHHGSSLSNHTRNNFQINKERNQHSFRNSENKSPIPIVVVEKFDPQGTTIVLNVKCVEKLVT